MGGRQLRTDIASVTLNATRNPIIKFRVQYKDRGADGLPTGDWKNLNLKSADPFGDGTTVSVGMNFRLAWSGPMPQPSDVKNGPAITNPQDYNNAGVTTGGRTYFGNPQLTNTPASGNTPEFVATTAFESNWKQAAYDQPLSTSVSGQLALLPADPMDAGGYFTTLPLTQAFPADSTLRAVAIESGIGLTPGCWRPAASMPGSGPCRIVSRGGTEARLLSPPEGAIMLATSPLGNSRLSTAWQSGISSCGLALSPVRKHVILS